MSKTQKILIYDRTTQQLVHERVLGDTLLRRSYQMPWRPFSRFLLFRFALFSRLMGWYCDSKFSRKNIHPTIRDLLIDMDEVEIPESGFTSFNDFFARRLKAEARPFNPDPAVLCAPADARYHVYRLEDGTCLPVKGASFTAAEFLRCPPADAAGFRGGYAVVARLCPSDYHRFHFPAAGHVVDSYTIRGRYDSVNPVALSLKLPVFVENRRTVSLLDLESFGRTAFVEVGAFGVGAIVQTHRGREFRKMEEKGYFKFGGSTVVLLFGPDQIRLDEDLLEHSREGFETLVKAGMPLGCALCNLA